jgi:DNA-binding NarL/FixJ family response regulator
MRLRGLGYDVLAIAKDGTEAIEKARELRPDLILMDIKLGDGMDGIEAARHIRTQYGIPVVYVSAYADRELLDRARATRPAGFINKPFTTKDLLTTIKLALDREKADRRAGEVPAARGGGESDPVLTADLDGRVTFINRSAEQLTGWTRDAVIGKPLGQLLSALYGIDQAAAEALVRQARTARTELPVTSPHPRGRSGHDSLTPLTDARGNDFGLALRFGDGAVQASLATLQHGLTAMRFVLDQLPLGVALTDGELRISYVNAHAVHVLGLHPGLSTAHGQLQASDAEDQEAVQALVRRADLRRSAGGEPTAEIVTLRVPGGDQRIILVALPLPAGTPEAAASVALLLFDSPGYRPLSGPVLREIYGLTRSEVNLVQALASGLSLEEGAHRLGIAVNTARTHLKHIFIKTGAKRQSELIHQVETGPAALPLKFERHD